MEDVITNDTQTANLVKYRVIRNGAASKLADKDVFTGVVDVKQTYNLSKLATLMVKQGCAVKKSTIKLVLNEFADLVSDLVADGCAVNIPGLVRFAPAIRGTFETQEAAWDTTTNQVVVNASVGRRMRTSATASSLLRVDAVVLPVLELLMDMAQQRQNVIASEGTFLVSGERLTWNTAAADEGWFLNVGGSESLCTVEGEPTEKYVILRTDQIFSSAGTAVELFFRFRTDDGVLRQVKYANPIVTATE